MHKEIEPILHPSYALEVGRAFIDENEGADLERFRSVAEAILNVYADVTGKQFSPLDLPYYPDQMLERLYGQFHRFEFRFGIPVLDYPAREHGKLWGSLVRIQLTGHYYKGYRFWVDTNDGSYEQPSPQASVELRQKFDAELAAVADTSFSDITCPMPRVSRSYYLPFNPAVSER